MTTYYYDNDAGPSHKDCWCKFDCKNDQEAIQKGQELHEKFRARFLVNSSVVFKENDTEEVAYIVVKQYGV